MRIIPVGFVLLFLLNQNAYALPTAKITIKVIDEQGVGIADANAGRG